MAALRRLVGRNPGLSYSSLLPPTLLICCRGIASKLFVGGLSFYTTEQGLSEAFSQYGQVIEAKIVMDRVSDRSKGFGFVTFASGDEAEKAIDEMNGKALNGRVIFVDYARPNTDFGGGMPIARGPPEPTAGERSTVRRCDLSQGHQRNQYQKQEFILFHVGIEQSLNTVDETLGNSL